MATKRQSVITHADDGAVVTASPLASAIPYLVRVMTRRQTASFIALVAIWLAAEGIFWSWWLRPSHVVTWYGMLVNSLLLAWPALMSAWFFFFVFRMKRPNPNLPAPMGRVAMIVTKAPSEPWPIVRETLEAMLTQRFPHPYDVWLADEDPNDETRQWCDAHGVQVSCRKGIVAYHRETWPRRTRCKEGNLAYFYDTYGYERYDFVSQLDADHVPSPTYLENIIRPFNDPAIGYVAAPSICDKNIDESWVVRGRLSYEASFHGPQQAGYNDGFAPSCIGSHYAVRTAALRQIGGLGPELAEDFTTTLMMNAGGWRGVFAIDAIAHGDGAGSFADSVIQEFQWSRSLVTVLLSITPKYWSKLPRRLKLQFGLVQIWYPITALYMAMIYVFFGLIALASRTPWVRVDLLDFVVHVGAIGCVSTVTVWWLRHQGWLRPKNAGFFSWELMLFQIIRWPWMAYGTVSAVVGSARNKTLNFRVTPKGANSLKPLPLSVLVPYILSAGAAAVTALICGNPDRATGYYLFGLMTAVMYLLVLIIVPVLHAAENRRFVTSPRPFTRPALAATMLLPLVLTAGIIRTPAIISIVKPQPTAAPQLAQAAPSTPTPIATQPENQSIAQGSGTPVATMTPAVDQVTTGSAIIPLALSTTSINLGAYDPTGKLSLPSGDIEQVFFAWDPSSNDAMRHSLETIVAGHHIPLMTVEPWPVAGIGGEQTLLTDIAAGKYDTVIDQMCETLSSVSPQTVLLRWGHEMELTGHYPWAQGKPAQFVAAYRHVFDTCRRPNIKFVWSPAGNSELSSYWPGSQYVDYVGLTALSVKAWSIAHGAKQAPSFSEVLTPRYNQVERYGKPVIVSEFGSTGTARTQRAWLASARSSFARFPLLAAVVYFNAKETRPWGEGILPDWRISQSLYDTLVPPPTPAAPVLGGELWKQ